MEPWTPRPNRDDRRTACPLLRARPGHTIKGIITTTDAIGAYTHYWRGRTTICLYPTCEPCSMSHAARWYGFLHLWNPDSNKTAIVEITPSCTLALDEWLAKFGTLRGAKATIQRANTKPNSRVDITLTAALYAPENLPHPIDLQAQLCRMWELQPDPTIINAHPRPTHPAAHNGAA
jgi:hypothetical protein